MEGVCWRHRSPRALPRVRRRQITRRRQWGWSSLRIARDLRLPLPTVVHVQRRLGRARRPRPAAPPVHRYERALPGELVHLDIKKLGRFRRVGHRIHGDHGRRSRGSGVEFLHIAIDDRTAWPKPPSSRTKPPRVPRPSWPWSTAGLRLGAWWCGPS